MVYRTVACQFATFQRNGFTIMLIDLVYPLVDARHSILDSCHASLEFQTGPHHIPTSNKFEVYMEAAILLLFVCEVLYVGLPVDLRVSFPN